MRKRLAKKPLFRQALDQLATVGDMFYYFLRQIHPFQRYWPAGTWRPLKYRRKRSVKQGKSAK